MQFGVLGPIQVLADDGTDATPRGLQQRQVLARLVLAAPAAVSIDALEDMLWRGPAPSGNALQALVSKLRKAIAPVQIESDGRGYSLAGTFTTDLDEHAKLVVAGQYEEAARLIRGASLPELDDDPSSLAERARLAATLRAGERKRVEARVLGPSPIDAVAELEARVVDEPEDEGWWALLMRAQHRSGQQAQALRTYQRARVVLGEQLGLEPGAELQALEREILDGQPAPPPASGATQRRSVALPARLSSFVGREHDLDQLTATIAATRLLTLVGPGGTGKTSTALELARRQPVGESAFVALAPVSDIDGIVRCIARAIGLPDSESSPRAGTVAADDPLDRIVAAMAASPLTLVVDNCEHVVADAAGIVHRLLTECAGVRVIATSREPLSVPGESVYPLRPLPEHEAIELFVQRAGEHAAAASLVSVDDESLRSLCERLDRLPLAIELAAARLRAMSFTELVDRLDDRFGVLSSGPRTAEPRQQTLRAVVDWSHDLLEPVEQIVFRRLAVFVGGASAEAAEVVAAGAFDEALDRSTVRAVIERLLDKSLIRVEHTPFGVRYSMLQTLHAYADERLAASGEREAILVRHAQFFADLVSGALVGLAHHGQSDWLVLLRRERQNVDAARQTAIARQDAQLALELIAPLGWYYYMTGELEAGCEAFADAFGCPGPTEPALRAVGLALYGWLESNGDRLEQAVALTSEAMSLIDRVDDPFQRGLIINTNVMATFFSGHVDRVHDLVPVIAELASQRDELWTAAVSSVVYGEVMQFTGDTAAAEGLFDWAASAFEQVGDMFSYALTITEASEIAELVGEYDRAVELLRRGIELAEHVGFSANPLAMRARLANVETLRGNYDTAEQYHQSLLDDVVASGVPWLQTMSLVGLAAVARRRGELERADRLLQQAWEVRRSKSVPYMRSIVTVARGFLADQRGDFAAALALQTDGLDTASSLGTPRGVAFSLEGCAGALAIGPPQHAGLGAQLLGAADQLRRSSGGPMPAGERFDVDRAELRLRAMLGDGDFDRQFRAGAEADHDQLAAAVESVALRAGVESAESGFSNVGGSESAESR